jgi:hypothetical protein
VIVPDYQLSLAIGKEGQNARLAARLTGWKIDIQPDRPADPAGESSADAPPAAREPSAAAQEPAGAEPPDAVPAAAEPAAEEPAAEEPGPTKPAGGQESAPGPGAPGTVRGGADAPAR